MENSLSRTQPSRRLVFYLSEIILVAAAAVLFGRLWEAFYPGWFWYMTVISFALLAYTFFVLDEDGRPQGNWGDGLILLISVVMELLAAIVPFVLALASYHLVVWIQSSRLIGYMAVPTPPVLENLVPLSFLVLWIVSNLIYWYLESKTESWYRQFQAAHEFTG